MEIWMVVITDESSNSFIEGVSNIFCDKLIPKLGDIISTGKTDSILIFPSILEESSGNFEFGANRISFRRKIRELQVVRRIDFRLWISATRARKFSLMAECVRDSIAQANDSILPIQDKSLLYAAIEEVRIDAIQTSC